MASEATHLGEALGTDFFSVREQFTDEQWDKFVTTWNCTGATEA